MIGFNLFKRNGHAPTFDEFMALENGTLRGERYIRDPRGAIEGNFIRSLSVGEVVEVPIGATIKKLYGQSRTFHGPRRIRVRTIDGVPHACLLP